MKANRDCYGEVAAYSYDIDLPNVTLCKGHVWELHIKAPPHEKMRIAEEMEGLAD